MLCRHPLGTWRLEFQLPLHDTRWLHGRKARPRRERRPQALQQVAEGCGAGFAPAATPQLRGLLFRGLHHPNRFVREAGYHTLAALARCAPPGTLAAWGAEAAARLHDGLSENWSQVGRAGPAAAGAGACAAGAWAPRLRPCSSTFS